jgi:hypothetical protein
MIGKHHQLSARIPDVRIARRDQFRLEYGLALADIDFTNVDLRKPFFRQSRPWVHVARTIMANSVV